MSHATTLLSGKTALVTGAARRIGASIARTLHAEGSNVAIHYRGSAGDARELCDALNGDRPDSAMVLQAELADTAALGRLVPATAERFGGLDILVNNASSFYATPLGSITESQWEDLLGSNLKAPLFLSQAAAPALRETGGNIINIVDIHAFKPLDDHPVYCAAKAGLAMLTRSLAKGLAPAIRVNGIAPGPILWPESGAADEMKQDILAHTALRRMGSPQDIADCVLYLVRDAGYVTGQIIAVDGGRSLFL